MVCSPDQDSHWTDTDFLLRKVVNPVCHGISITILLVVAITYFVVPSLRDLVGNVITTITCLLIVGQVANLMRIFSEFRNHFNFLILGKFIQIVWSKCAVFLIDHSFIFFHDRYFRTSKCNGFILLAEQFGLFHLENIPVTKCVPTSYRWQEILYVLVLCMGFNDNHGINGRICPSLPWDCTKEKFCGRWPGVYW